MKKKIIIDCDVGVDDALALILAFHSPELEVKAVTGVNGNVPLERVFANIQKVLSLIQPAQRPIIARGADRPLQGKPSYAHSVHGEDGLGGAFVEKAGEEKWWELFPGPAAALITETARQYPDEVTLVAIGPLTNLAFALREGPQGMSLFKKNSDHGGRRPHPGQCHPPCRI